MMTVRRGGLLLAILAVGGLLGVLVRGDNSVGTPGRLLEDPVGPVLWPLAAPSRPAVRALPPTPDLTAEVPAAPASSATPPNDLSAAGSLTDEPLATPPSDPSVTGPLTDEPPSTAGPSDDVMVGSPRGEPSRLVIPAIAVDVGLGRLGLAADGTMEMPAFGGAGWYDEGPPPGRPGPAVIAAHVDSRQGPDVFFRLRELTGGEEVRVAFDTGDVARFVVERQQQTSKDELPVELIWPVTAEVRLTLITCGGRFDRSIGSYGDNVIVYARPAAP
jgi:hypothetical protein